MRHQMGLLYEEFTKENENWKMLEQDLRKSLTASNENLDGEWENHVCNICVCAYINKS